MKYECVFCKYETFEKSNYNQHLKTKKHIEKQNRNNENNENNEINNIKLEKIKKKIKKESAKNNKNYLCCYCNKGFNHQSSQSRHEKTCKKKSNVTKKVVNSLNKLNNKIENDNINNILEIIEKKNDEKINEKIKEIKEEISDTFHENTMSIQKIATEAKNFAQTTLSTVGFIIKYLNDAPVIEKNVDYLKALQFDKNKLNLKDDEKIVEDLISFRRHGTLVKYLGDIIIRFYKKDDPTKQSIWNSDMTRKNYLLRELVNKKPLWITDKGGILTSDIVIHPLLMTVRELMVDYLSKPVISPTAKIMTPEADKRYFNNDTIMNIIIDIDDNKLHDDIGQYLCPYFHFDKNIYLDKVSELNKTLEYGKEKK